MASLGWIPKILKAPHIEEPSRYTHNDEHRLQQGKVAQGKQAWELPPPEARNTVSNGCVRAFLADPPATGAENAAPQPPPMPRAPMPVPPGLDVMQANV